METRTIWLAITLAAAAAWPVPADSVGQVVAEGVIISGEEVAVGIAGKSLITDRSFYRAMVGNDGLRSGSPALGFGSYTLIHGPSVEPETHYLLVPKAKAASGKAKARITAFEVTFQQIVGPPNDLRRGPLDIYRGVIDYRADPINPPVNGDHNGSVITPAEVARVLVNWWLLRETVQFVQCGVWNHTIGLGTGIFCFNVPWWKGLEDEFEFNTELKLTSPKPKPYRGWLLLPIEPRNLVSIHWLVEIEAWPKGQMSQRQTYALIGDIEFDADGDGWPNGTEIDRGTNPFDPNSFPTHLISVPDVVGQLEAVAQSTLQQVGLFLGAVQHEYSATMPAGRVTRQSPVATSQVLPGSAVSIWLSLGPEEPPTTTVPSVVNKTISEATTILGGAGLSLCGIDTAYHPTVPAGKIISQTPVAGTQVPLGTCVDVVKSLGPPPPVTVATPSIVNKTPVQADALLEGAGLDLHPGPYAEVYHPTIPAGRFVSQTPATGTQVPLGTVVTGTLSNGPPPPDPLMVTIDSPANNFVGTVGQSISFTCTVTGGVGPYSFKWHFPDNSFKYQEDVTKTFDIPGAGWVYLDVTDAETTVQKKIWIQINNPT